MKPIRDYRPTVPHILLCIPFADQLWDEQALIRGVLSSLHQYFCFQKRSFAAKMPEVRDRMKPSWRSNSRYAQTR